MECICGCGTPVRRDSLDANLQATSIALELLAWDKARTEDKVAREESEQVEALIYRGSQQYRQLLDSIHGEREAAPLAEGESWLGESRRLRHGRQHMTERGLLGVGNRLRLTEEEIEMLDREQPQRSFSGRDRPTGDPEAEVETQMERLLALHADGVLSDQELAAARRRIADDR